MKSAFNPAFALDVFVSCAGPVCRNILCSCFLHGLASCEVSLANAHFAFVYFCSFRIFSENGGSKCSGTLTRE